MDEGKGTWEEVLHLAVLLHCIHRMGAEGLGCADPNLQPQILHWADGIEMCSLKPAAPNPALDWQLPQIYSPKSCQAGSCLKPHPQILPRIGEAAASPGKREEGWRPLSAQEHSEERDSQGQTAPPRRRTKPAGEQEINRKERRGGGRGAGG